MWTSQWVMSHMWTSQWVMSHMRTSQVLHMNESCHIWMSHAPQMNESRPACEWVISLHMNSHQRIKSYTWTSHVTNVQVHVSTPSQARFGVLLQHKYCPWDIRLFWQNTGLFLWNIAFDTHNVQVNVSTPSKARFGVLLQHKYCPWDGTEFRPLVTTCNFFLHSIFFFWLPCKYCPCDGVLLCASFFLRHAHILSIGWHRITTSFHNV